MILCDDFCCDCKERFQKDPSNYGDYNEEGSLLRFCPVCGQMLPFLSVSPRDETLISNGMKKRIIVRIAKKNSLNYRSIGPILRNLKEVNDEKQFIRALTEELKTNFNLTVEEPILQSFL